MYRHAYWLLFVLNAGLACDEERSPTDPGTTSFSGEYHVESTVSPHACPAGTAAPTRGTHFSRTVLLEDHRPDLNGLFGGVHVTGTIGLSGSFRGRNQPEPLTTLEIEGDVTTTTNPAVRQMSGEATHIVFGAPFDVLCEWVEEFVGSKTDDLPGPLPPS